MATASGLNVNEVVDTTKAQRVLEFTGDIETAAQMYWDDYIATRDSTEGSKIAPLDVPHAAPFVHGVPVVDSQVDGNVSQVRESGRKRNDHDGRQGHIEAVDQIIRDTVRRLSDRRRPNRVVGLAQRAAAVLVASNDTASVSDDESGEVWKMVGSMLERDKKLPTPPKKRTKREIILPRLCVGDLKSDGYLSDNDWIWESLSSRTQIPTCTPFELLWKLPSPSVPNIEGVHALSMSLGRENSHLASNVIADDEGEEPTSDDCGFPKTWLNASFSFDDAFNGLVLKPPEEEDLSFFSWQQQAVEMENQDNEFKSPPPFHCGSLTALPAIVTALLYSGVHVQAGTAVVDSSRVAFKNLTEEERRDEADNRLVDALTVILHIAATSSRRRKEKALSKLKTSTNASDRRKWQKLQSKLKLCPTCWWCKDNGEAVVPQGQDMDKDLCIATSYANINDLKAYVLSNFHAFSSRGGCALFLETIVRIHGKGAIMKMIENGRKETDQPSKMTQSLICCTCQNYNQSAKLTLQQTRQRQRVRELMQVFPVGSNCVAIELISLLLCGTAHSTFTGWSSGALGVGIITDKPGQVGISLSRPSTPTWLVVGPTCYSTLWYSNGFETARSVAQASQPGSDVELTHFCCWVGQRGTTTLNLIPDYSKRRAHRTSNVRYKTPVTTSAKDRILQRRCTSVEDRPQMEFDSTRPSLTRGEVEYRSEDEKLYPGRYQLWWYRLGEGMEFRPYARLSEDKKRAVERKMGPTLNATLFTRWPEATIQGYSPPNPPPMV